ncbi:hypothetical protein [Gordonia oryzae]|uniref:hypothetical protein n=1 Tax=Gordonia oryzae TaxID=2487349 RepID=UPI0026B99D98
MFKASPTEELIRAVRLVAHGAAALDPAVSARVLDPAVSARVIDTYRRALGPTAPQAAPDGLTSREPTVLGLIGRGFTNDEMARNS